MGILWTVNLNLNTFLLPCATFYGISMGGKKQLSYEDPCVIYSEYDLPDMRAAKL